MSSASDKFRDLLRELFHRLHHPCEELRTRYDDGTWDRARFGERHILFREQSAPYDHVARMIDPEEDAAAKGVVA